MTLKYGGAHQAERQRWQPIVLAGQAHCVEPVCLMRDRRIEPHGAWDLSHDPSGTVWLGPSHRKCNRAEGARRGNRMRGRLRPMTTWTL